MKTAPDKWGTPIKYDVSDLVELRKMRGVKAFDEFPKATQEIYLAVAKCFPGWQVWAVGSRVRGDYIDKIDYGRFVQKARAKAGMKPKDESDFDFMVAPDAVQVGELPPNTERLKCRIPESEKIEIPIFQNGMELG